MKLDQLECAHGCKNSCAMLSEAMRLESMHVQFYEKLIELCDYPDVNNLFQELAEERSKSILRIIQKLNEVEARSQIIDGVISSFESGEGM
jgi:rubrerythrin